MGIDGFRLDAIPYLFEREGTNCENLPETHAFLKRLRAHIDSKYDNKLFLAEANMWPEDSASYFGDGDECHMNYHFPIMPRMFMALKMEDRYPITDIIDQTPVIPDNCQWAIFLRNHDELTLEMVTDEERDYMYKVYTKDPQAKINVGIRHRLAPLLENNRDKIELMNVLLFSLPGTPVIYYGDEIGMGDNFYLGDRDGVRTPMQWTGDRNAGFSSANPHKLYLPVIIDPEYTFESVNVEAQEMNSSSLLWWMKRIIRMRKQYKAFGRGSIRFLSPANAKVIAFIREFEEEVILVLCNLSRFAQAAELDLSDFEGAVPIEVFSRNPFPRIGREPYLFTMAQHGYYWFSLERERVPIKEQGVPELKIAKWANLKSKYNRTRLESQILPRFLDGSSWYAGRERIRQSLDILEAIDISGTGVSGLLLVLKTTYNDGLPEHYQLLLSWVQESLDILRDIPQEAVVSHLELDGIPGYLVDGIFDERLRGLMLGYVRKGKNILSGGGSLQWAGAKKKIGPGAESLRSRVQDYGLTYGSLDYEDRYHLKIYRRLDDTINPDLELSQFLSEESHFEYVPTYLGSITFGQGSSRRLALGMAQDLVPHQGTAWENAVDAFGRYLEQALTLSPEERAQSPREPISHPLTFEDMPEDLKELMGSAFPERMITLGERSAELHLALAAVPEREGFEHEPFSLHYQRSVFSSLQGLTRGAFDLLKQRLETLPQAMQEKASLLLQRHGEVLDCFRRIYKHKMNTLKIRTHGDFHLDQILWTGRDFIIRNFEGEPMRPFSERRLKRSPLRDVAGMIRSLHYAAHSSGHLEEGLRSDRKEAAAYWSDLWSYSSSRLFLHGYMNTLQDSAFIPDSERDYRVLLDTFLLEKAVYELSYELQHRPDWAHIPMEGIFHILDAAKESGD